MADRKGTPHMRKKLIALSIALLTIGGSLTFTSTAKADGLTSGATQYLLAAAGERTAVFLDTAPQATILNNGTYWYGNSLSTGFSPSSSISQRQADSTMGTLRMSWHAHEINSSGGGIGGYRIGDLYGLNYSTTTVKEIWVSNDVSGGYYPEGIQQNVDVSTIAEGGWTLCYSANLADRLPSRADLRTMCTGDYILLAGGYRTGQEPTPPASLTLPPDFLTPKTYGNPASVTGYAPAAPAVALTPTAPVITAGTTSVIYNGVPQSATYSVDQKSSCSTTYNGSAIPPVAAGTYAVSLTCTANSLTSTATTTLTITKAAPVISWSTPAAITSSTKLGASQLNAFSYIPGSFTYSASAGSSLPIGDDLITATFTPTDTTNYTSATMTVTIKVTA